MKYKCPSCGGTDVVWDYACHTWPGGTREDGSVQWMACIGCDSARRYTCLDCTWDYTHGYNPNNPRFENEEKSKPDWIDDEWLKTDPQTTPPEMKSLWD